MKISILPRFVVLKSNLNNKYLQLVHHQEGEVDESPGRLQFTGEDIATPFAKFEVEPAKSDRRFVHLKCCSNNKYWVVASSSDGTVAAAADKPEEDQSKSSCTLFQPIAADDLNTFRFKSASQGKYANVDDQDTSGAFTAIDWTSTVSQLPTTEDTTVRSTKRIHSLEFHTFAGVISSQQELLVGRGSAVNTNDHSIEAVFEFNHSDSKLTTWNNSNPADSGVHVTLTSGFPYVTQGKIQISAEETFSYQWGSLRFVGANVPTSFHVIVPPRSLVSIMFMLVKSTCEVPFSYTQDNNLRFDDGVCTSTSDSDLRFEQWFESIN